MKPDPASSPRQRSTVSRSTPASAAIVAVPEATRAGIASTTRALAVSSSSRSGAEAAVAAGDVALNAEDKAAGLDIISDLAAAKAALGVKTS